MGDLALDVWVDNIRVGRLVQDNYEYVFQYENLSRLSPERHLVSLTMPVRLKQYDTQMLMPAFQTSLPEGALLENLRTRFGKLMDINNDMVLLKLIGNNTIGRVRFSDSDPSVKQPEASTQTLTDLLTYPETEALFVELLEQFGVQSGVSGVQPKVLWSEQGQRIALNQDGYILKSAGREYPGLAVNEYFCLEAARAAGLKTPEYFLSDSGEMLVVKRFDVTPAGKNLAFEEVCALLNRPNHGKYTGSYEEVVSILQKVPCKPVNETNRDIFKSVVFSMMIQNGDAHLKNFAVVYDDPADVSLAPFYDLVCTTVYIPRDLPALTIEGKKSWPDNETLKRFGLDTCGLRTREVKACMDEVRSGINETTSRIESYGSENQHYQQLCQNLAQVFRSTATS